MEESRPPEVVISQAEATRQGGREPGASLKRDVPAPIRRSIERLALLGVVPEDSDEVRVQKVTLTLASETVTVLSFIWVGTYLVLGLPWSAAIPFTYQVASVVTLVAFARTKDYRFFRFSQIVLIFLLPFLLQWSLGGYVASSAVSLWALVGVFGALFFYSARGAVPWFVVFVVLTVVSGLIDPRLATSATTIPMGVQVSFFVLNILGVALTAYLLLQYSLRTRDAALAQSESLLLNVLPRSIAERLKRDPGVIAERYDEVTVLFADIADFTPYAERTSPEQVVGVLDEIFSAFDALTERHGLEKIKTIGDAYMVAGGLPEPRVDHAEAIAAMAIEMQAELARVRQALGLGLDIRIGIDSGPVVSIDGEPLTRHALRLTHLYRREAGEWKVVHEHSDFQPADHEVPGPTSIQTAAEALPPNEGRHPGSALDLYPTIWIGDSEAGRRADAKADRATHTGRVARAIPVRVLEHARLLHLSQRR